MPHEEAKARKTELLISNLLRAGVLLSLGTIVLGTMITFAHHPDYATQSAALHELTHPSKPPAHSVGEVLRRVADWRGQGVVTLGLLLLLLTPVARVAVSVFAFARQRDRMYVAITCAVLGILLLSMAVGVAMG